MNKSPQLRHTAARQAARKLFQSGCSLLLLPLCLFLLAACDARRDTQAIAATDTADDSIFDPGSRAVSEHYTGTIRISGIARKGTYDVNHLIFEAGSHNDWHIHPDADQLMLVLDGEGYYQEEGQPKRLLRKGDIVDTPANVKHWNGATPGKRFVHLTITDRSDKGHIEWFEPVSDEEYLSPVNER